MKHPTLAIAATVLSCSAAFAGQVTSVIDPFTTFQLIATNNASVTNTIVSGNSIGGFRTLILSTAGITTNVNTFFGVDNVSQRLILNTPASTTPNFDVLWGGAGGTNGLGGYDFGAGQPLDLTTSTLSFGLGSSDQPNNFTWTFTDMLGSSAVYTGTFPVHAETNPPIPFNIALSSFTNAAGVNWNAIKFVNFSGGDASGVDMTTLAPIQVVASTVPEPGTWALLVSGLAAAGVALRRKATRRD